MILPNKWTVKISNKNANNFAELLLSEMYCHGDCADIVWDYEWVKCRKPTQMTWFVVSEISKTFFACATPKSFVEDSELISINSIRNHFNPKNKPWWEGGRL